MSNMRHCRFENALDDLRDCEQTLGDLGGDIDKLSVAEKTAALKLIECCRRIAADYG